MESTNNNQPPSNPPATPNQPSNALVNSDDQRGMFKGRLNRIGYFLEFVYSLVFSTIASILSGILGIQGKQDTVNYVYTIVVFVILAYFGISAGIRRLHDLDKSGWYIFLWLLPFVGAIGMLIYSLFFAGTVGPNKYGDIDNRPGTINKVVFGR